MKNLMSSRLLAVTTVLITFIVSPMLYAQTYTDMHDFSGTDGCCANYPSMLVQGQDGNIYGATTSGGKLGGGNIFRMTPSGTFTDIYDFDGTHGEFPQGGISLGFDGNFYGTTYQGGAGLPELSSKSRLRARRRISITSQTATMEPTRAHLQFRLPMGTSMASPATARTRCSTNSPRPERSAS